MQVRVITMKYNEGQQGFSEEALRSATFGRDVLVFRRRWQSIAIDGSRQRSNRKQSRAIDGSRIESNRGRSTAIEMRSDAA